MTNLMSGDFYPHGKPGIYSYTKHFVVNYGGKTAYKAVENTKYPGLDGFDKGIIIKALWNLESLIQGARNAELAFIRDTGIDLNNPNNAGDIFRTINKIFNSKQTFERGIKYMKSLADAKAGEKDKMYRDVTRYFSYYLGENVKKKITEIGEDVILKMTPKQIEQVINDIIGDALVMSYKQVKDFVGSNGKIQGKFGKNHAVNEKDSDMEEVTAITDMITTIESLRDSGAFSKFGYLFGMDLDKMTQNGNQNFLELKNKNYNYTKVSANYGGNALELITSTVATKIANMNIASSGLTITGVHTGQDNEMKADTLLFVSKSNIDPANYMKYVDTEGFGGSVRRQNIYALERYLIDLNKNVEHVIAISDKNYSIKSSFSGIAAQEKMSLQNAGAMLEQFGVDHVPELITYLANCGEAMVQGPMADSVRTELQSYIGYFLFDNLQVEINGARPKPNVVNLMNVSGIYIPLSVYLEGLYNSIKDVAANPSSFVNVTVKLEGPIEQSIWTEDTWEQFRDDHETQSFISYRILKNLAEFITNL